MTDDLIEAVATAIWNELPVNGNTKDVARAAIRAAAPLILNMAADEAQTCGFTDRESLRNSISFAIRQLKERFQ